jgi:4-hydroxybenzoate polyprenyltransferase
VGGRKKGRRGWLMDLVVVGMFIVYIIMALYIFSEKNVRRSVVEKIWMLIYMTILLMIAVDIVKGG